MSLEPERCDLGTGASTCKLFQKRNNRDFPRTNLWPVIVFSQIETEIPKFYIINFPMSDFVLHFDENFMKIATKIIKLLYS